MPCHDPQGATTPLNGSITFVPFRPKDSMCCQYHTFIFHAKDPALVLFGHLPTCNIFKDLVAGDGKSLFPVYAEGPFEGSYAVFETMADHPLTHRTPVFNQDGKFIMWYVRIEDVRHLLADKAIERWNSRKKDGGEKGEEKPKSHEKAADDDKTTSDRESRESTAETGNRGDVNENRASVSYNADGENVAGSGSRPRRMTRGQDELRPQIQAFSEFNLQDTPSNPQAERSAGLSSSANEEDRQPVQICPYHGTDRCEVDDPTWFDRRQHLFDHNRHPADSCAEEIARQAQQQHARSRHHRRSHPTPRRIRSHRRRAIRQAQNRNGGDVNDDSAPRLRGGAYPKRRGLSDALRDMLPCLAFIRRSSEDDLAIAAEEGRCRAVSRTTGYQPMEGMRYGAQPKSGLGGGQQARDAQKPSEVATPTVPSVPTPTPTPAPAAAPALVNLDKLILFKEKCGCVQRMVSDYSEPEQQAPLIYQILCLQHNLDPEHRQPWAIYTANNNSLPPPYQSTPYRPPTPSPYVAGSRQYDDNESTGLRGGALNSPEAPSSLSGPTGANTSDRSESQLDNQASETTAQGNDGSRDNERAGPSSENRTSFAERTIERMLSALNSPRSSEMNAFDCGVNPEGYWDSNWESQYLSERRKNLQEAEAKLSTREAAVTYREAQCANLGEKVFAEKTALEEPATSSHATSTTAAPATKPSTMFINSGVIYGGVPALHAGGALQESYANRTHTERLDPATMFILNLQAEAAILREEIYSLKEQLDNAREQSLNCFRSCQYLDEMLVVLRDRQDALLQRMYYPASAYQGMHNFPRYYHHQGAPTAEATMHVPKEQTHIPYPHIQHQAFGPPHANDHHIQHHPPPPHHPTPAPTQLHQPTCTCPACRPPPRQAPSQPTFQVRAAHLVRPGGVPSAQLLNNESLSNTAFLPAKQFRAQGLPKTTGVEARWDEERGVEEWRGGREVVREKGKEKGEMGEMGKRVREEKRKKRGGK